MGSAKVDADSETAVKRHGDHVGTIVTSYQAINIVAIVTHLHI